MDSKWTEKLLYCQISYLYNYTLIKWLSCNSEKIELVLQIELASLVQFVELVQFFSELHSKPFN